MFFVIRLDGQSMLSSQFRQDDRRNNLKIRKIKESTVLMKTFRLYKEGIALEAVHFQI